MNDLPERIRQRIRDDGPMRFRDWMEACLYDPEDGYYMRPGRITGTGDDADFATSPTLHPFMAEAVAKEAIDAWSMAGQPTDFVVVEFGGGEGDLARDALTYIDHDAPDLANVLRWIHVETSPTHRAAQTSDDGRIEAADAMPDAVTGLVVAHEFIDALPFCILEWRKHNWAEVFVDVDDEGRFVELLGLPNRSAIEAAPKRKFEEGQRVVSMPDAQSWLIDVAEGLQRGRILIVDYGDQGKWLWTPERPDATVRGFRQHRLVDPWQEEPGTCDITANVDFTQLEQWATFDGFRAHGLETQESFLIRHGALEALAEAPKDTLEEASAYLRMKQLVLPQVMGTAFKALRLDRGIGDRANSDG